MKPLKDRLRNELQGTTADPEAVEEIFWDWLEDLRTKGHLGGNWHDGAQQVRMWAKDGD